MNRARYTQFRQKHPNAVVQNIPSIDNGEIDQLAQRIRKLAGSIIT